jgi:hypothetical protein
LKKARGEVKEGRKRKRRGFCYGMWIDIKRVKAGEATRKKRVELVYKIEEL